MDFIKQYKWEIILVIVAIIFLFTPLQSHLKRIFSLATEIKLDDKQNALLKESWGITYAGYNKPNLTLEELKGNVIFLHYWGTWCSDCRLEMPILKKLYDKNKDKISFVLVAKEKGNPEEKLNNFLKENPNFNFPIYTELGTLTNQLNPDQFPTTFIIDKKGNLVAKIIGATDWTSPKIQKLFIKLTK